MKLTPEQVDSFKNKGFFVLRGAFAPAELAALRPGTRPSEEHATSKSKAVDPRCVVYGCPLTGEDPNQIIKLEGLGRLPADTVFSEIFQKCGRDAGLSSIASQLLGPTAELMKDKYIFKSKENGCGFIPHQDMTFIYSRCCTEAVNFGIAFDDADESNGSLEVCVEGYQHTKGRHILPTTESKMDYATVEHLKFEHVNTKAGDVIVFSGWLLHQSTANKATRDRNVYYVTYGINGIQSATAKTKSLYENYYELYDAWIASGYLVGKAVDDILCKQPQLNNNNTTNNENQNNNNTTNNNNNNTTTTNNNTDNSTNDSAADRTDMLRPSLIPDDCVGVGLPRQSQTV